MAFCGQCGAQNVDGLNFCTTCGTPFAGPSTTIARTAEPLGSIVTPSQQPIFYTPARAVAYEPAYVGDTRGATIAAIGGTVAAVGFFLPIAGSAGLMITGPDLSKLLGWFWLLPLMGVSAALMRLAPPNNMRLRIIFGAFHIALGFGSVTTLFMYPSIGSSAAGLQIGWFAIQFGLIAVAIGGFVSLLDLTRGIPPLAGLQPADWSEQESPTELLEEIDQLKAVLRQTEPPYTAADLYALGRLYALLFEQTQEPASRASALKYMRLAAEGDEGFFEEFFGAYDREPFGILMSDPEFLEFAR